MKPPTPLCAAEPPRPGRDPWFPNNPTQLAEARRVCGICPLREACLAGARERKERSGVWGGVLFGTPPVWARPAHGTVAGYRRHRVAGTKSCRRCRKAWALDCATRKARRPAAVSA